MTAQSGGMPAEVRFAFQEHRLEHVVLAFPNEQEDYEGTGVDDAKALAAQVSTKHGKPIDWSAKGTAFHGCGCTWATPEVTVELEYIYFGMDPPAIRSNLTLTYKSASGTGL